MDGGRRGTVDLVVRFMLLEKERTGCDGTSRHEAWYPPPTLVRFAGTKEEIAANSYAEFPPSLPLSPPFPRNQHYL